ncbi:MAG: YybH family protein [Candidatus Binatia bacterium]
MLKFAAFVAVMVVALPLRAEQARTRSTDEAAIRNLYASYDASWNKADLKAMGALWAEDADHVEPDGRMITGRAALEQDLAKRFATDLRGTRSAQTVEAVRLIKPDVAVVDAAYEVTGVQDAEGKALPPLKGRYVDIWIKRGKTWQIIVDRPVAALRVPR